MGAKWDRQRRKGLAFARCGFTVIGASDLRVAKYTTANDNNVAVAQRALAA